MKFMNFSVNFFGFSPMAQNDKGKSVNFQAFYKNSRKNSQKRLKQSVFVSEAFNFGERG